MSNQRPQPSSPPSCPFSVSGVPHGVLVFSPPPDEGLPALKGKQLFELVYSCRKHSPDGEEVVLTSLEECGMVAEPCVDAGTNPGISEVTYQVNKSARSAPCVTGVWAVGGL